jgi:hypothetical protein
LAALGDISDAASREAVHLLMMLAFDGLFRADFDAMRAAATRALTMPRPLGDQPLTATAASVLMLACSWGGLTTEAEAAREEAVELVDAMPDHQLARRIDAPALSVGW